MLPSSIPVLRSDSLQCVGINFRIGDQSCDQARRNKVFVEVIKVSLQYRQSTQDGAKRGILDELLLVSRVQICQYVCRVDSMSGTGSSNVLVFRRGNKEVGFWVCRLTKKQVQVEKYDQL
jgi:hypothetical protein